MDNLTTARLEIIAAKAKILVEASKRGFWGGELKRGLEEIEAEISRIQSESSDYSSGYGR